MCYKVNSCLPQIFVSMVFYSLKMWKKQKETLS